MEKIVTTDLYQAAWYIINGLDLEEVVCIPISGNTTCKLSFTGTDAFKIQEIFIQRKAISNLYSFRSAYNQVNIFIQQAKKNYWIKVRAEKREARLSAEKEGHL